MIVFPKTKPFGSSKKPFLTLNPLLICDSNIHLFEQLGNRKLQEEMVENMQVESHLLDSVFLSSKMVWAILRWILDMGKRFRSPNFYPAT